MAEPMCGPSNALQQFKQQTDVDRTLQQDRLSARQRNNPAQGFRSSNPQVGLLDAEFEAFQAGASLPAQDHGQHFERPPIFGGGPSRAPAWAADFQRMQISKPAASFHEQRHFQPSPASADWAHGFREHFAQSSPRAFNSSPPSQTFQQRAVYGLTGFQSQFAPMNHASPAIHSKGKAPMQQEQFDDSAFAAAFDQAHEDMMAETEAETQEAAQEEVPSAQDLLEEVEAARIEAAVEEAATRILKEDGHDMDMEDLHPMARTHSADVEHVALQEETTTEQKLRDEDDALAATAEELLDKVKDNQSDKFKNSQFLGLMRKLRDREVRVQGDKMVETANASTASLTDTTLNASSNAPAERTYYGKPQPAPLPVDTRPPEYGIPHAEQDHDLGRINPHDGQDVVDLLNSRSSLTEDIGYDPTYSESYASASPSWKPF